MQHSTTLTKTACVSALIIGVLAAAFAFSTKTPGYAVTAGAVAAFVGLVSLYIGRKSIDDMQLAAAGIFMAIVSCLVGLWQIYN
jgi:bacteriorhodopsin